MVLLDRDGTINVEKGFLADPEKVELLPGAAAAIKKLNTAGWAVAIVTNQSGVGRGLYTLPAMHATNARVVELVAAQGARVDAVEACPHHPDAGHPLLRRVCPCRKPLPGMAVRASQALGATLTGCVAIGDRLTDVRMGLELGGKGILVLTGYGEQQRRLAARARVVPSAIVPDLPAAVDWLLGSAGKP